MSKVKNKLIHENAPEGWYPSAGDFVEGKLYGGSLVVRGKVLEHRRDPNRAAIYTPYRGCLVLLDNGEIMKLVELVPITLKA